MSYSKSELIEEIVGLRLAHGNSAVTLQDRNRLSQYSTAQLETELQQLREAGKRNYIEETLASLRAKDPVIREAEKEHQRRLAQIDAERIWATFFFRHQDIIDTTASRKLLYERAFTLADDGVVTLQHLDEAAKLEAANLVRRNVPTPGNRAEDEETLRKYCRVTKRHFNIASFNQLREQFGARFTSTDIDSALQSGLISLGPATREESDQWAAEDQEARTEFLLNATPQVLRREAKKESVQKRSAAVAEADRQHMEAVVARDAVSGYPPLPNTWQGRPLDADFIKTCDPKTHRFLSQRFGSAQLDLRLRGIR